MGGGGERGSAKVRARARERERTWRAKNSLLLVAPPSPPSFPFSFFCFFVSTHPIPPRTRGNSVIHAHFFFSFAEKVRDEKRIGESCFFGHFRCFFSVFSLRITDSLSFSLLSFSHVTSHPASPPQHTPARAQMPPAGPPPGGERCRAGRRRGGAAAAAALVAEAAAVADGEAERQLAAAAAAVKGAAQKIPAEMIGASSAAVPSGWPRPPWPRRGLRRVVEEVEVFEKRSSSSSSSSSLLPRASKAVEFRSRCSSPYRPL